MNVSISPYEVYTDGSMKSDGVNFACGDGGWSFVVVRDNVIIYERDDYQFDTTNQKMELTAAAEALEYIETIRKPGEEVVVYSDSAYLINCYMKEWYKIWMRNGWVNSKKEPVANKNLWLRIVPFFNYRRYTFEKVKGHSDNYYNNMCDKKAQEAAERGKKIHEQQKREQYYNSKQ